MLSQKHLAEGRTACLLVCLNVCSIVFLPAQAFTCVLSHIVFNTLRPGQNGWHFLDNIFKCIFLNENVWIPIKISLKFVPKGPINNIPALVQIMAWRRSGNKPLSEPMMVSLLMHLCVTRPQWVNIRTICYSLRPENCSYEPLIPVKNWQSSLSSRQSSWLELSTNLVGCLKYQSQ